MMTTRKQSLQNQYSLQYLENISRKLASPFGSTLTDEEALLLKQLRHKENDTTHLRSLDQFFANSRVIR
jgi:hypothetical protein